MRRREWLATLATSGAILTAGCNSAVENTLDNSETSPTPEPATGRTPSNEAGQDTATATPEPAIEATVVESTDDPREYETWTQFGVRSWVENTGDVWLGFVNVSARFYNDDDDQLLNTGAGGVRALAPGEVWEFWIPYSGEAEDVDSSEVVISDSAELHRALDPDTVEVESSSVEIPSDDNASPVVTATVGNASDTTVEYLQAHPKIYDDDGFLIGTGTTSVSGLESGQEWRINTGVYLQNPTWKDRVEDHEIVLVV